MADAVPMGREFQEIWDRNKLVLPIQGFVAADPIKEPVTSAQIITLPFWQASERGTPNSFLRSSLFAAGQGQHRRQMKNEVLNSQKGITIKFTGEQLNQSDLDVWEALINLAREHPLGNACSFSTHGLLKSLGLHTGKSDYTWFHSVILRLASAHVEIIHDKRRYGGTLLHEWGRDDENARYKIVMNKKLINLYGPTQWTAIDWHQRRNLRKHPLAQALHAFYSSHAEPFPMKVQTLKDITGSTNRHLGSFKRQVALALATLVSIGFLKDFSFEAGLVCVTRLPSGTGYGAQLPKIR